MPLKIVEQKDRYDLVSRMGYTLAQVPKSVPSEELSVTLSIMSHAIEAAGCLACYAKDGDSAALKAMIFATLHDMDELDRQYDPAINN